MKQAPGEVAAESSPVHGSPERPRLWSILVMLALVYLGVAEALPSYLDFRNKPGVSVELGVSLFVAAIGWFGYRPTPARRRFLVFAGFFGGWVLVGAIASWDRRSMYYGAIFAITILVIVPGMSAVMTTARHRNAMIAGFVGAGLIYGGVVLFRQLQGRSVLDVFVTGELAGGGLILGRNRTIVSMVCLIAVAFLLGRRWTGPLAYMRWVIIALCVAPLFLGGGRSGPLALGTMMIVFALVRPGVGRKAQRLLLVTLLLFAFIAVTTSVNGPAGAATNRVRQFLQGQRTDADEARVFVARKAWNLGWNNAAFGVGYGRFTESYSPVVESAPDLRVRLATNRLNAHDTFAQVFAENGLPGLVTFVAMLLALLGMAVRSRSHMYGRSATASMAIVMQMILFDTILGSNIVLAMALVLSVAEAASRDGLWS